MTEDFYTPKAELIGMELTLSHLDMLEDARTEFPTAVFAAPETIRIGDVVLSRVDMFPNLPAGRHRWFAAPITSMPYLLGLLEGSYTNSGVLIVRGHRSKTAKLHRIELTRADLAKIAPMDVQGVQDMLDAKHGPGKYLVSSWDRVDYAQATPAWDHPEYGRPLGDARCCGAGEVMEHKPDWTDVDHEAGEDANCSCGFNGTHRECKAQREYDLQAGVDGY